MEIEFARGLGQACEIGPEHAACRRLVLLVGLFGRLRGRVQIGVDLLQPALDRLLFLLLPSVVQRDQRVAVWRREALGTTALFRDARGQYVDGLRLGQHGFDSLVSLGQRLCLDPPKRSLQVCKRVILQADLAIGGVPVLGVLVAVALCRLEVLGHFGRTAGGLFQVHRKQFRASFQVLDFADELLDARERDPVFVAHRRPLQPCFLVTDLRVQAADPLAKYSLIAQPCGIGLPERVPLGLEVLLAPLERFAAQIEPLDPGMAGNEAVEHEAVLRQPSPVAWRQVGSRRITRLEPTQQARHERFESRLLDGDQWQQTVLVVRGSTAHVRRQDPVRIMHSPGKVGRRVERLRIVNDDRQPQRPEEPLKRRRPGRVRDLDHFRQQVMGHASQTKRVAKRLDIARPRHEPLGQLVELRVDLRALRGPRLSVPLARGQFNATRLAIEPEHGGIGDGNALTCFAHDFQHGESIARLKMLVAHARQLLGHPTLRGAKFPVQSLSLGEIFVMPGDTRDRAIEGPIQALAFTNRLLERGTHAVQIARRRRQPCMGQRPLQRHDLRIDRPPALVPLRPFGQ